MVPQLDLKMILVIILAPVVDVLAPKRDINYLTA